MKKVIIGFIAGAIFATAGSSFAATSLIGKKVDSQYNVTLDGSTIGQAIVIQGTSYLPVRKVADSLDIDVAFKNNQISLETDNGINISVTLPTWLDESLKEKGIDFPKSDDSSKVSIIKSELLSVNRSIELNQSTIDRQATLIDQYNSEIEMYTGKPDSVPLIEDRKVRIATCEQRISEAQAKLTDLQTKKADLENILKQMGGA